MGNSTLPRFFAVIALSFSCLSLSVLPMSKGWGQQTKQRFFVNSEQNRNYCGSERNARALQRIGSQAVPDLVRALQNKDATVRADAANLLGSIDKKAVSSAIPNLVAASKNDPYPEVRVCGVSALISIAGNDLNQSTSEVKAVIPAVIAALKDNDTEVRLTATNAFSSISSDGKFIPELKAAIPVLLEKLKDKDEEVRSNAADALQNIGSSDTAFILPLLVKALKDKDAAVRVNAASISRFIYLIQKRTDKEVASLVPALIEALKNDKEAQVRSSAAEALRSIGKQAASAVPALAEALQKDKDAEVRSSAGSALDSIGKEAASAVPALIQALKNDKEADVRSNAASALGSIGEKAASAVPALIEALKNENVRNAAISSWGRIAESYQDNASKLSSTDLDKAISNLEKALKAADDLKDNFTDEQKAPLRRSLYLLKKEKDSRFIDRTLEWMVKHPWVTGALIYIIFVPSLWFALLRLRPLWLLHIDNALKPFSSFKLPDILGGGTLPIRTLLFIEFFNYRPRVLDAWVVAHIDSAKEGFGKKKTVSDRFVHVPIPVILDKNNLAHLTGKDLQPTFDKKRATLLLWGEGGAGKTSLACQLAMWAMSDDANQRISQHKMLPVLIEQELDFDVAAGKQPLTEAICGQLQALIGEAEPIPEELLAHLLRQRRILVIVDHLSEMSEATRKQIRPGDPDFTANALIVTSRLEEKLDEIPKTTIKPLRVAGDRLSSFMEAYLTQRGKRNLFDDPEYFDACRRLSLMVGQRNITVLLAKLYAEQMIASDISYTDLITGSV
jgi:HEAT repeat protein